MLPLMAALCMALSSCSFAEDGSTHTADDVPLTPAADIYNDAEAVINAAHKAFHFEKGVTVSGSTDINKLTLTYVKDTPDDILKKSELLGKAAFGDEFDTKNGSLSYFDDGGLKGFEYSANGRYLDCYYDNTFMFERSADASSQHFEGDDGSSLFDAFVPRSADVSPSDTLHLKNGDTTFKQYSALFDDMINKSLSPLVAPLEVKPDLFIPFEAFGDKGVYTHLRYFYKGLPIDYTLTADITKDQKEGETSYFSPLEMWSVGYSPDAPDSLVARDHMYYKGEEKIDALISFKDAVALLENELAPNTDYPIIRCELALCRINTQKEELTPDEFEGIPYGQDMTYTPYWVFYIDNSPCAGFTESHVYSTLRVDALTGRIYVLLMGG